MAEPLSDNVLDFTPPKPSASIVYITPDMAKRWLGRNHVNRNVRSKKVDAYARDMAAGRWQLTGEAIKFAADGSLFDGQHRLHAIVKSGVTVPMFVVRGLSAETQQVMDTGAARTVADALSMTGHKNSVSLASTTRAILQRAGTSGVSNAEILEAVAQDPDLQRAASIAVHYARGCDLAPTIVGLSSWVIAETAGFDAAEDFWRTAHDLVGLSHGDPILAMLKCFAEYRRSGKKLDQEAQLSVIIRTYNHRRRGHQIQLMKVNSQKTGGRIPVPEVAR